MQTRALTRTLGALMGNPRPFILYHKPTGQCDCRCRFCDSWMHASKESDILPSPVILSLLDSAARAGFSVYTVWGGEPLLVPDLPAWLHFAKKQSLITVLCTSGMRLEERADELANETDRLLLSLEAIGSRQDRLRQQPGLFDRVVQGLDRFRKQSRALVTIWCNLNRLNHDLVFDLCRFVKEQRLSIEFFPTIGLGTFNQDILLEPSLQRQVFRQIQQYKKEGYPILNTWHALRLMEKQRAFTCQLPRISIHVDPAGQVFACDSKVLQSALCYGTIDQIDLGRLAQSQAYQKTRQQLKHCNRCQFPCVLHTSGCLWLQAGRKAFELGKHVLWRTLPFRQENRQTGTEVP